MPIDNSFLMDYSTMSIQDLHDLLARQTINYNQFLLHGRNRQEYSELKSSIKKLQEEIKKRRQRKEV